MLLVTVVATSPGLQGQASEFTDASGQFVLSNLPPGSYSLIYIYGDAKVRRDSVNVSIGKVTVANAKINQQATEVVTIKEKAPAIDAGSTKQGSTLQQDYLKNVPSRGRTYEAVLGAAGGSQGDFYGMSFSGSTSVENSYIVDGVNTTGVKVGGVQSPVLNNFIQEIEVITGGYNAEFGRSTGGVVNVVTKTGSNEFHGSVWANVTPYEAKRDPVVSAASAFFFRDKLGAEADFGFDVGGPIIKDKLWFYLGFAPAINSVTRARVVGTRVDRNRRFFNYNNPNCNKNSDGTCDGDGNPATTAAPGCELMAANGAACESDGNVDLDSANQPVIEEIERREATNRTTVYQFTGKLNFAVSPDHQGQISFIGAPEVDHNVVCANGSDNACQDNESIITADAAFKWTSKFNNNKTQVDAVFGWHRQKGTIGPATPFLPNSPTRPSANEQFISIEKAQTISSGGNVNGRTSLPSGAPNPAAIAVGRNYDQNESNAVMNACRDETVGFVSVDQFPRINNCQSTTYLFGGFGVTDATLDKRMTGKLTLTQRVKALGHHQFKAGADFEINEISDQRLRSGGSTVRYITSAGSAALPAGNYWRIREYAKVDPMGNDICIIGADDALTKCNKLPGGIPIDASTFNWAAFIQDSWSILPNLTVNAGLRYEEQRINYPNQEQSVIDPITGNPVGTQALKLSGLFAPRIGVIYDWTKEGRSKIYANWGRFYESIPMDMNERSFGAEQEVVTFWNGAAGGACGMLAPDNDPNGLRIPSLPQNCPTSQSLAQRATFAQVTSVNNSIALQAPGLTTVVPGLKAQSMDEIVVGAEYEVLEDLRLGLSYQNRRINEVVEDVSTDGANSYYFANPGSFDANEEQNMLNQIASMQAGEIRDAYIKRLADYRQIRRFDKPVRNYNAVQLTVAKRFSRSFMVQGSYTYSRLEGNYPGLFKPDTNQNDPNLTSQYDLFELLGNQFGRLPFDRPHSIKLDGYYTFDLEKAGRVTTGLRLRALSGRPVEATGAHGLYGRRESYILPRGTAGRTDFQSQADVHVAYARKVGDVDVEVYFELFNILNNQVETNKDFEYTLQFVHPIIGGDTSDLPYLRQLGGQPVNKNINWTNTTVRQAPLTGRVGLTIAF
jgi:outer membrane receptor protein involved in Fe transport